MTNPRDELRRKQLEQLKRSNGLASEIKSTPAVSSVDDQIVSPEAREALKTAGRFTAMVGRGLVDAGRKAAEVAVEKTRDIKKGIDDRREKERIAESASGLIVHDGMGGLPEDLIAIVDVMIEPGVDQEFIPDEDISNYLFSDANAGMSTSDDMDVVRDWESHNDVSPLVASKVSQTPPDQSCETAGDISTPLEATSQVKRPNWLLIGGVFITAALCLLGAVWWMSISHPVAAIPQQTAQPMPTQQVEAPIPVEKPAVAPVIDQPLVIAPLEEPTEPVVADTPTPSAVPMVPPAPTETAKVGPPVATVAKPKPKPTKTVAKPTPKKEPAPDWQDKANDDIDAWAKKLDE